MKKDINVKKFTSLSFKFDLKMKLTTLFLIVSLFQLQANESYGQKTRITLKLEKVSTEKVLNKIESLSEFKFFFNYKEFDYKKEVSINAKNERISSILKRLFKGSDISFHVIDKQIVLSLKKEVKNKESVITSVLKQQEFKVTGTISDINGVPLPGANVVVKGTSVGTQTDFDGNYTLEIEDSNAILIVSYVGYITQEININGQTIVDVSLKEDAAKLDEIIIVGYGSQKKAKYCWIYKFYRWRGSK